MHPCATVIKQYNLVPAKGAGVISLAGKVAAGLVESNCSLYTTVFMTNVTCQETSFVPSARNQLWDYFSLLCIRHFLFCFQRQLGYLLRLPVCPCHLCYDVAFYSKWNNEAASGSVLFLSAFVCPYLCISVFAQYSVQGLRWTQTLAGAGEQLLFSVILSRSIYVCLFADFRHCKALGNSGAWHSVSKNSVRSDWGVRI